MEIECWFPEASPDGTILHVGNQAVGMWIGVTSGQLTFRHGHLETSPPYNVANEMAIIRTSVTPYEGRSVKFYVELDWNSGGKLTVWEWDKDNYIPVEIANDSPVIWPPSFGSWAPGATLARVAAIAPGNTLRRPVNLGRRSMGSSVKSKRGTAQSGPRIF